MAVEYVKGNALFVDVQKVLEKINTVDLTNIDRIGLAGDSYTEGLYSIKGKAWACRFSELLDYNVESIGEGGITCQGLSTRIKDNTPRYHATLGWQDFKPTKAMLMSFVNDMATGSTNSETYQTGMKELVKTVKEYGAEPIVCTEFRSTWGTGIEAGMKATSQELGVKFWNILNYTAFLRETPDYAPYWQGSHPGTRTGYVILDQYLREAKKLDRPSKSLKIFRKLPNVVVTNVSDLEYHSAFDRMKLFKEISIGHSALVDPTKYDVINTYTTYSTIDSEYLRLLNGDIVSFDDYVVVECVIPSTRPNVSKIKINLSDATVSSYILKERVWTAMTDGETTDLDGCFEYDKVKILLYKSGGFDLTSISLDWVGVEGKKASNFNKETVITSGTELLTNNFFLDNTGRTVTGSLPSIDTDDLVFPTGSTKIVRLTDANFFEISIPNASNKVGITQRVKLRMAVRYYPTEGSTEVDEFSFDWAELKIDVYGQLSGGTTRTYYKLNRYVGMHWTLVEVEFDLPDGTESQRITVKANTRPVEIAYISALEY